MECYLPIWNSDTVLFLITFPECLVVVHQVITCSYVLWRCERCEWWPQHNSDTALVTTSTFVALSWNMSRILQDIAGMRAIVIATAIFIGVGIGVGIGFFSFAPDPCEDYTMFHEKSLDYFSQKQTSGTAPDAKISDHINLVICLSYSNSSFLEAEVLLKSILHKLPPPADHLVGGIRIHLMLDTTAYSSFQSLFSDNNFNKSVWVVPVTIRLWHVSMALQCANILSQRVRVGMTSCFVLFDTICYRLHQVSQKASNTMRLIVDKNIVEYSTFHSVAQW